MNVGGHCPTKSTQSFLLASLREADTPMDASASQYQVYLWDAAVTLKNLR